MSDIEHNNIIAEVFTTDSKVTEVLDKAGAVNEQLYGVLELDDENRKRLYDILEGLAKEWPLFNKEVLFSGLIRVAQRGLNMQDEYSPNTDSTARIVVPSEGVSLGFDLVERDEEVYVAHMIGFDMTDSGRLVYPKSSKSPMYIGRAKLNNLIIKDALDEHYDNRDYLEKYHKNETDRISKLLAGGK